MLWCWFATNLNTIAAVMLTVIQQYFRDNFYDGWIRPSDITILFVSINFRPIYFITYYVHEDTFAALRIVESRVCFFFMYWQIIYLTETRIERPWLNTKSMDRSQCNKQIKITEQRKYLHWNECPSRHFVANRRRKDVKTTQVRRYDGG